MRVRLLEAERSLMESQAANAEHAAQIAALEADRERIEDLMRSMQQDLEIAKWEFDAQQRILDDVVTERDRLEQQTESLSAQVTMLEKRLAATQKSG